MKPIRLTLYLSAIEFRMRDQGTFLGFLWTLLKPLLLFLTLYAVFSPTFAGKISSFNSYLLAGVILWDFFSSGTQTGSSILFRRPQYVLSSTTHPSVICFGAILSIYYANVLEAILGGIMLSFLGEHGVPFATHLIIGLTLCLPIVYGFSCLLATCTTLFLDTLFLWSIILRIGFFITPIFYPITALSDSMLILAKLNPLYFPLALARCSDIVEFLTFDTAGMPYFLSFSVTLLVIGALILNHYRYRFVEVV